MATVATDRRPGHRRPLNEAMIGAFPSYEKPSARAIGRSAVAGQIAAAAAGAAVTRRQGSRSIADVVRRPPFAWADRYRRGAIAAWELVAIHSAVSSGIPGARIQASRRRRDDRYAPESIADQWQSYACVAYDVAGLMR